MTDQEKTREQRFVEDVIGRCKQDKGLTARLRRSESEQLAHESWELLARWGVDLEKPWQRIPFSMIAASIAKARPDSNGGQGLGQVLAGCYPEGSNSTAAQARIRRLLACDTLEELQRVLRPVLSLAISRSQASKLDFALLLKQLGGFGLDNSRERTKAQWAQGFYNRREGA